jgi:transposase
MTKREHRRFTAKQKLEILREAEQPGVSVSEVCRRHGLATSVFYRWRAVAQGGSAVALKRDAQRTLRKDDPEARHKAEMERMRAVIAEITAENLELKKNDLRLEDFSRVSAETKAAVMHIVEQTKRQSGWRVYRTLAALGLPRSVNYGWKKRENLEDQAGKPCRVYEGFDSLHLLGSLERANKCQDDLPASNANAREIIL